MLHKIFKGAISLYYNLSLFGKKLCKLRQALGFSQDEVARLSSVNIQTLRRIENGKVIPKQETLEFLSPVYKIDLNNLLLRYRIDGYSSLNNIKNRIESKLDRDEFYNLDIELNELNTLLITVKHPYFKILINQLVLLIESVILNKRDKNPTEAFEKLIEAIKTTTPKFSLSNFSSFVYSTMEIRILMNIALLLNKIESAEKCLEVIEFCFESIEPNDEMYPKICYNLSYTYHRLDRHDDALKVSSLGIDYCLSNRNYIGLNHLYFRKGVAKFELEHDDYMDFLKKAIHQCEILGQYRLKDMMVRNCKRIYDIEL